VRTDEASGITNEQMSEVEEWLANVG
jgi:hypothetical protein